jgi:CMP/dCMP kinase
VDAPVTGVPVEQGGQVRVVGLGGDEPVEGSADVVVAIDGPAGSGKSTVARRVAERAGLRYLDTGATYRALTLALLRRGIPVADAEAVADAAKAVDLTLELPPGPAGAARVLLDGVEPGPALRTPEVNAAVSVVAAVPAVRELLVGLQRSLVAVGGIVVEGRDIGTVVWPDADVKVFLTASEHERVRRRGGDAEGGGETAETLARRDAIDSGRAASPTRPAADALVIDSTTRSIDQVVDLLLQLIDAARASRPR